MHCNRFNIGFGVFRSNENHCKIFKIKCHVEVVFFRPWIWPMLMENTQNPPFLHVKRENTRKTGTKMVENTLFLRSTKYWRYIRGWMSTSHFRLFRVQEPVLTPSTVIYLFRRKVTKPTISDWLLYFHLTINGFRSLDTGIYTSWVSWQYPLCLN